MQWEAVGVEPKHWSNATAIRRIFHDAFAAVGMPYFNPHSIRNTLVRLGETRCKTPEDFKAFSQNLGHAHVLTTFTSYGEVPARRQSEIIQALRTGRSVNAGGSTEKLPEAMVRMLKEMGFERAVK